MKGIVSIKASPARPVELLRHTYRAHGREQDEIDVQDRVVQILHNLDGIALRDPIGDVRSLLSEHHGQGRMVRHVILSLEDCADLKQREEAFHKLKVMIQDFSKTYCPDSKWIGVIHQDRLHPHAHLVVANSDKKKHSPGGQKFSSKCSRWSGPTKQLLVEGEALEKPFPPTHSPQI
jgi:hypothetical protein